MDGEMTRYIGFVKRLFVYIAVCLYLAALYGAAQLGWWLAMNT